MVAISANLVMQYIDEKNPIALLLYFAYPDKQKSHYQAWHYKQRISFWSKDDLVSPFARGRNWLVGVPEIVIPALRDNSVPFGREVGKIDVSVQVTINGQGPGHSEIREVFPFLAQIIADLHYLYRRHYSLSGNLKLK